MLSFSNMCSRANICCNDIGKFYSSIFRVLLSVLYRLAWLWTENIRMLIDTSVISFENVAKLHTDTARIACEPFSTCYELALLNHRTRTQ